MDCKFILLLIIILLFYINHFEYKYVEGMVLPDYYKEYSFLDNSSKNREKMDMLHKNYIKLVREKIDEIQSGKGLEQKELDDYMALQIAKARRITENSMMNDLKYTNPDGSWNDEIIKNVNRIITDLDKEEELLHKENIKDLSEKEKNEKNDDFNKKKENRDKQIEEQIKRWGKPLYLLTKKEMDIIYKNILENNQVIDKNLKKRKERKNTRRKRQRRR